MNNILIGLEQFLTPAVLGALILGTLLGLVVGALPGLNDSITIAVLIPVTFGMDPHVALSLLVGIYTASACGGSIPAVLLEIPGTASAMVTAWDGYPMTLKGYSKQALSLCMISSFLGGISSALVLLCFAPTLASLALRFAPPEYFMLTVLGMSTVIGMAGENVAKNFLSMSLGLWISCIGMSSMTGIDRYTFSIPSLLDGIPLIPQMIGLFGIFSVLKICDAVGRKKDEVTLAAEAAKSISDDKIGFPGWAMCKRLFSTWVRSSTIGNILGVIPGAGMTMAIFMAYDRAKKSRPELPFGTGVPEGVAAPESANNAVVASSMVPLLSLGIPGNGTSALFLGALTIQGLRPGPELFNEHPDLGYMIIIGFILANLMMLPMSLLFCKYCASRVLKLNSKILSAGVLVLCVTGSYAYMNNPFHIGVMLFFGVLGYVFWKFGLPQAPLILSTVIGPMMENNWMASMVYADGSFLVFLQRPISLMLLILSMFFLICPFAQRTLKNIRAMK
ncbi:MAG: tripartite tricarboxylate transporter permease [Pyramidobacter sp.]|uniref:tripartite tricarboxylate transporter permease n=1 Tax=Pyramidobacter sp. TaxID=1943581 RepID=UPI002A7F6DE8|nr:tripartite tricarboxylate transporter permease [Pyramidobacter sp.]MDY4032580.1 tripartite tricarboxylate transporter permease [Pyramidobacter sp.]